jgi:anthranilate synthase component II
LLIDNYDSFTYNIVELLRSLDLQNITVVFNNQITVLQAAKYDKIIISPGPATPIESGNIIEIIQALSPTHSILGICLGHQAIAEAFGASLIQLALPHHGYQTEIEAHKPHRIFNEIEMPCKVGLYHSWMVDASHFPACLEITSFSNDGHIMSLQHKEYDVSGIQFHPESYMTKHGKQMLGNFFTNTTKK